MTKRWPTDNQLITVVMVMRATDEGKKKNGRKEEKKKEKRAQRGTLPPPRWANKLIFLTRTVKRNRNEVEAQKKIEHPT